MSPNPPTRDRRRHRGALLAGGALGLALWAATPAPALVYTLSKATDSADGLCDQDCSLREAVIAANSSKGPDVIVLAPGIYRLQLPTPPEQADSDLDGDLDVRDPLLIAGAGAPGTVIDAAGLDRAFDVVAGGLELVDLTVRHGAAAGGGGGIRSARPLIVRRVELRQNTAAEDGGAILSVGVQASLQVIDSTLADNTAARGGGIAAGASLQLRNSTLSGNTAGAGSGGGLLVMAGATATLRNVTVHLNSATVRGGGIQADGAASVANSIVAGNDAPEAPDAGGSVTSAGHNVWGIADAVSTLSSDLAGDATTPLDPGLAILAANGGPTATHLPLAGSPALGAGNLDPQAGISCETADQRGALRGDSAAGACEAGAVEATAVCVPGGGHLCLGAGRFELSATWHTATGAGFAQAAPLTADSGSLWFFDAQNLELTVKVLDGCAVNGHFWVFSSGLTDVGVALLVRDTHTGRERRYLNSVGQVFPTGLDTSAFPCSGG